MDVKDLQSNKNRNNDGGLLGMLWSAGSGNSKDSEEDQQQAIEIEILSYRHTDRQFLARPTFYRRSIDGNSHQEISWKEAQSLNIPRPSSSWLLEYQRWNTFGLDEPQAMSDEEEKQAWYEEDTGISANMAPAFGRATNCSSAAGHPVFDSVEELHEFNKQGHALVEMLRLELEAGNHKKKHTSPIFNSKNRHSGDSALKVFVRPFRPVYSHLQVGNAICSWWHVKDVNYPGFVVPLQHLPISVDLKSRIKVWEIKKSEKWLLPESQRSYNQEGFAIQQALAQELNHRHRHHQYGQRFFSDSHVVYPGGMKDGDLHLICECKKLRGYCSSNNDDSSVPLEDIWPSSRSDCRVFDQDSGHFVFFLGGGLTEACLAAS